MDDFVISLSGVPELPDWPITQLRSFNSILHASARLGLGGLTKRICWGKLGVEIFDFECFFCCLS